MDQSVNYKKIWGNIFVSFLPQEFKVLFSMISTIPIIEEKFAFNDTEIYILHKSKTVTEYMQ